MLYPAQISDSQQTSLGIQTRPPNTYRDRNIRAKGYVSLLADSTSHINWTHTQVWLQSAAFDPFS